MSSVHCTSRDTKLTSLSNQDEEPYTAGDVQQQWHRIGRAAQHAYNGIPYPQHLLLQPRVVRVGERGPRGGRVVDGCAAHEWRGQAPACAYHEEAENPAEEGGLWDGRGGRVGIHRVGIWGTEVASLPGDAPAVATTDKEDGRGDPECYAWVLLCIVSSWSCTTCTCQGCVADSVGAGAEIRSDALQLHFDHSISPTSTCACSAPSTAATHSMLSIPESPSHRIEAVRPGQSDASRHLMPAAADPRSTRHHAFHPAPWTQHFYHMPAPINSL